MINVIPVDRIMESVPAGGGGANRFFSDLFSFNSCMSLCPTRLFGGARFSCFHLFLNYWGGEKILSPPHHFHWGGDRPPRPPIISIPDGRHVMLQEAAKRAYFSFKKKLLVPKEAKKTSYE